MNAPMEAARRVADAVLYEGYLLYPYRASAVKNRMRWQFGVLVPPGFTATGEPSASTTECLIESAGDAVLDLRLRFLHLRARTVERAYRRGRHIAYRAVPELTADGWTHLGFDDATEREERIVLPLAELIRAERTLEVRVPGGRSIEPIGRAGRTVAEHEPLRAAARIAAEPLPGPYGLLKLRVRVENTTPWDHGPRELALRRSLIAAHLILALPPAASGSGPARRHGAAFVSLLDPPEWATGAARACRNENTFPVLAGAPGCREVVLSSPIILYDHVMVAPESPGDLFDATEIDELLSLRVRALTEEEQREARATDRRAAEIIDRTGDLPPQLMERLHGAIRCMGAGPSPRAGTPVGGPPEPARAWWSPGADPEVSPETDAVVVAGVPLARGSRVRLRPRRRADAHDMFLAGRTARVEAVYLDVDGARHLAVTLDDDPAADLLRAEGRFLYFAPDEIEPLGGEEDRADEEGAR